MRLIPGDLLRARYDRRFRRPCTRIGTAVSGVVAAEIVCRGPVLVVRGSALDFYRRWACHAAPPKGFMAASSSLRSTRTRRLPLR